MKNICFIIFFLLLFISVKGQKDINHYKIIGDSTSTYKSIDDILNIKELKGKVVYVDIWGTRCPPCIKQFEYLPDLKKRFENDSIIYLYLCSPYTTYWDRNNEKLWKELIIKHNLKGINILMSAESYKDGFFEKYKDKYS